MLMTDEIRKKVLDGLKREAIEDASRGPHYEELSDEVLRGEHDMDRPERADDDS